MSQWAKRVAQIPDLLSWWRLSETPGPFPNSVPGGSQASVSGVPIGRGPALLPFDTLASARMTTGNQRIDALDVTWGDTWSVMCVAAFDPATANGAWVLSVGWWTRFVYLSGDGNLVWHSTRTITAPGSGTPLRVDDRVPRLYVFSRQGNDVYIHLDGELNWTGSYQGIGPADGAGETPRLAVVQHPAHSDPTPYSISDLAIVTGRRVDDGEVAEFWAAYNQPELPEAPQGVVAEAGLRRATVSWEPPAWDGGAEVEGYWVEWDDA